MLKKTILVVDDEKEIAELVSVCLTSEGYEVITCGSGLDAYDAVCRRRIDLALLDVMLPDIDGFTLCRKIRENYYFPIIMLTARVAGEDKVRGLNLGADDYITKPFNSREVVARVKAVLRRAGTQDKKGDASRIVYDGLIIDMEQYQVTAFGHKMTFTTKEMELLWCLASNPGKAFSRNQLLETIWGYSYYGDTRTVDTHIKRIRQKLNIPADAKWDITTIWGVGYKFEVKDK